MSLSQAIDETQVYSENYSASFEVLSEHLPTEWVERSLSLSSHATIRRRRLPEDMVLWLVIGMAMFRNEPINEVARRLNICADGLATDELLARSGLSQARQRLGEEPMKWLFKRCACVWGQERYPQDNWHGLQLFAIDGALFRTQDTPELRTHFGSGNTGDQRHWLIPAKKNCVYEVVEAYGNGDCLIKMRVSAEARKRNPSLPEHWTARAVTYEVGGKQKTVLTSLPAAQYSAKQVAALYHERWEIELGFRDIKSSMQHNAITLRSKKVDLVYQELWGLMLAYNLIRREASQAAVEHNRTPSEISFKFAFQFIATQLIVMAGAVSPGHTPRRLKELRGSLATLFIEKRPRPSRPRAVKISKTRYPVNRQASPLK